MYKQILTAVTVIVLLCLPTAWAADTSATAAILMDGDTGEVLYEKNPDRQMLIASTTKLMTTLVVLERGGLGDVVTVTQQHIAEGSSMYLKPGDRVTVEELLYGLTYEVEINIFANNRTGLIVDISRMFTEAEIDVKSMNCRLNKKEFATISVGFDIHGKEELNRIIDKLRKIDGVTDITRTAG